jgi:hypothetical protein
MTSNLRESFPPSVAWFTSPAGDSAPSEARKRGSGGGSPRKHVDTSNLRESFPQPFCSMVHQPSRGQRAERSEKTGDWGRIPQEAR